MIIPLNIETAIHKDNYKVDIIITNYDGKMWVDSVEFIGSPKKTKYQVSALLSSHIMEVIEKINDDKTN